MPPILNGPRCNRRVTCSPSPSNARSESVVVINPADPYHLVGASKRFTSPATYAFSLGTYASFDGGQSWTESAPLVLLPGTGPNDPAWAGTTDPALAWDDQGNVYLVALPFALGTSPTNYVGKTLGMAVYKSADGGRTWGPPQVIHRVDFRDDKQWAVGDTSPNSPFRGNVYAAWDYGGGLTNSELAFARTTNHGISWKGTGSDPAGALVPGVRDCLSPDIFVSHNGTVYIAWVSLTRRQIELVMSTDGGNSFSAPIVVASGITPIPNPLPGGTFRTYSLPSACAGAGGIVIVTWADYREGVSRIYYRRSMNGGAQWTGPASGQPLLIGALASDPAVHDFHPQVAVTPDGEIGCAFYAFGHFTKGTMAGKRIHVQLALSTDHGASFGQRITVTDQPWDPTVDAPFVRGDPNITFIGEYFGLDASRLGFFPLWTDTRTGTQELFTSRLPLNPTDVFIRDSSTDIGDVPSPGFHWEYVDLIVRRQPDGHLSFLNEDLLRDGQTDHYIYARVTNRGANVARNVRLAVTVGNYPALNGLPGGEFRYPQDWYPGNWNTPALRSNHLFLGESAPVNIPIGPGGSQFIIGPIVWRAAQIPAPNASPPWHPCLLAEVRADNDDSAGGVDGCGIDADPDPCAFSSYFWGNNNIAQRNLTYVPVSPLATERIECPFVVGNPLSPARYLEVIIEKGPELAQTEVSLRMEKVYLADQPSEPSTAPCPIGEIVFLEGGRVLVRANGCDLGELIAAPGTIWRPRSPSTAEVSETCFGGRKEGDRWILTEQRASVGFAVEPGELRRVTLALATPALLEPGARAYVRVFQRNDQRLIAGGVVWEIEARRLEAPAPGLSRRRLVSKRPKLKKTARTAE